MTDNKIRSRLDELAKQRREIEREERELKTLIDCVRVQPSAQPNHDPRIEWCDIGMPTIRPLRYQSAFRHTIRMSP